MSPATSVVQIAPTNMGPLGRTLPQLSCGYTASKTHSTKPASREATVLPTRSDRRRWQRLCTRAPANVVYETSPMNTQLHVSHGGGGSFAERFKVLSTALMQRKCKKSFAWNLQGTISAQVHPQANDVQRSTCSFAPSMLWNLQRYHARQ